MGPVKRTLQIPAVNGNGSPGEQPSLLSLALGPVKEQL